MISAVFPIHKEYSDLILSGYKDIEFRNIRTKLDVGNKVYIYETKRNGGLGKVVGFFVCGEIKEIPNEKIGTYTMLPYYVERFGTDEEKEAVKQIMRINFKHYYNSLALSYLFLKKEIIDEVVEKQEPIHWLSYKCSIDKEYSKQYYEAQEKRKALEEKCDEWLGKIGFYNVDFGEKSSWKYMIKIESYKRFEQPINITDFCKLNGTSLKKAPQSFCYINEL